MKLQQLSTSSTAWELGWPSLRCQVYTELGIVLIQSAEETDFIQELKAREDTIEQNWRLKSWYKPSGPTSPWRSILLESWDLKKQQLAWNSKKTWLSLANCLH